MSLLERIAPIVVRAGEILTEKMESGFSISKKGQIDLVTDADRAVEQFLINELQSAFPAASFCAEERGWLENNASDAVWFIDPLDGTTNFAHGFPYFSISVALAKGETIAGVVYNPVSRSCLQRKRSGAALNGRPIAVSRIADLQDSLLVTGFRRYQNECCRQHGPVRPGIQSLPRRPPPGSAALDLCSVACGRLEGY